MKEESIKKRKKENIYIVVPTVKGMRSKQMDYYKLRTIILKKIVDHLERREDIMKEGGKPPKFEDFQRRLILDHGISKKMVKDMVETVVPGGTVKDGEIKRLDE